MSAHRFWVAAHEPRFTDKLALYSLKQTCLLQSVGGFRWLQRCQMGSLLKICGATGLLATLACAVVIATAISEPWR